MIELQTNVHESRSVASELNNMGLQWLRAGDLGHARECFHRTLTELKKNWGMVSPPSSEAIPMFSSSTPANKSSEQEPTSPYTSTISYCAQTSLDSIGPLPLSPTSILYTQAIPMPPGNARISSDPRLDQRVCSAICVFNLGLVYHLKGGSDANASSFPPLSYGDRQELLKKAQSLYEKSKALIFGLGLEYCASTHPIADLVSMAVLNNHAHVSYELFEFEKANQDARLLVHVASIVIPSQYGDNDVASVLYQAKQEFLLNTVTSLKSPTTARAA